MDARIPVYLESPFRGKDKQEEWRNILYARRCMADSLQRGEAPFASHLLYTQHRILNDAIPEERLRGIAAGLVWAKRATKCVAYVDFGETAGMKFGFKIHKLPIEYRKLDKTILAEILHHAGY